MKEKPKSFYSVADFIREYYPEYWGLQIYSQSECVTIHKITDDWGLFCNFAHTPIVVDGVTFKSSEELFQLMKFTDPEILERIRSGITRDGKTCHEIKRTVKSYEKEYRRPDWGQMFIDAMKYCLVQKYAQSPEFLAKLEESKGRYIVEDQSSFAKKQPDAWGVKANGDNFTGPNILGRLLMELRDKGKLDYNLPDDALDFIRFLRK